MMQAGANMLVIGGAGFSGSHMVKRPLAHRRSGSGWRPCPDVVVRGLLTVTPIYGLGGAA